MVYRWYKDHFLVPFNWFPFNIRTYIRPILEYAILIAPCGVVKDHIDFKQIPTQIELNRFNIFALSFKWLRDHITDSRRLKELRQNSQQTISLRTLIRPSGIFEVSSGAPQKNNFLIAPSTEQLQRYTWKNTPACLEHLAMHTKNLVIPEESGRISF